jgi:thiamine transport system ATP-binding protein
MSLELSHVSVSYDGSPFLDDVSLEVGDGEVLGVLGPSGSGKSTLLRAICGLEPLDAGAILWDGVDLTREPVHERGFALMFQDGQLFAHQSVARNVGYALRVRRAPEEPRVSELLEIVGLAGFGDRRVTELSGGEQQRVALARSLAASPRLLLLDEPLSSLDRELRGRLAADLREILTATKQSALFVTHDQDEAFAVSDRIAIIMDGELVQAGTPHQVRANPATPAIARFLGLS